MNKEIIIKSTKSADTRSANKLVTKEELLSDSKKHIEGVQAAIEFMRDKLLEVGNLHDWTKLENIDEFYNDFSAIQLGDKRDFREMPWYKEIHLEKERHHLDQKVPEGVTLFDLLERIADITTAGMARTGKVYSDELPVEVLQEAYWNTVKLIKSKIIVED